MGALLTQIYATSAFPICTEQVRDGDVESKKKPAEAGLFFRTGKGP